MFSVLGLACAPKVFASTASGIEFSVKPWVCVLSEQEESCHDELTIKWSANEKYSLCLYRNGNSKPLMCWEDVKEGQFSFILSTNNNVDFELRTMHKERVVAHEKFLVTHNHKRYRRARRNPWSFF